MELLERLFGNKFTMYGLAAGMIAAVGLVLLALSWGLLRNRGPRADRLEQAYRRFQRKLARHGIAAFTHEGPLDYGRRAALVLPQLAEPIGRIVQHYTRLRYGKEADRQQREQLERKIREFKA